MNKLISFKSSIQNNSFEVILDNPNQTFWATEQQIAELFQRDRTVISRHLKNIFKEQELVKNSVCAKFAHTANDGKKYNVNHYNLDVIISVGYRVKSKIATEFRIWATKVLKQHLVEGYSINSKRLEQLQKTIQLVNRTSQISGDTKDLLEILSDYSKALAILDNYDHRTISTIKSSQNSTFKINYDEAKQAIEKLRIKFGGSELFGREKDESFKSSIATIDQTFDGKELYQSLEEKSANLLYFVVKNHSFTDGNKRIAAWLFIWYLHMNNNLYKEDGTQLINNNTLATLTLMIAESNPKEKDIIIDVIINLMTT